MDKSTGIRLKQSTIQALRLIGSEISLKRGEPLTSDDERLSALIDHYRKTAQPILEPQPAEGTS